jgi:hypothetical protein
MSELSLAEESGITFPNVINSKNFSFFKNHLTIVSCAVSCPVYLFINSLMSSVIFYCLLSSLILTSLLYSFCLCSLCQVLSCTVFCLV